MPDTTPLVVVTVAMVGLLLLHVPPAVALLRVVVVPEQRVAEPVLAAGVLFAVIVLVAVPVPQLLVTV
jgi:hypothetical protein